MYPVIVPIKSNYRQAIDVCERGMCWLAFKVVKYNFVTHRKLLTADRH